MKYSSLRASAAVLALAVAQPALADVTAPQIWEQWQAMVVDMGDTGPILTADSESYADGVLTLDGVSLDLTVEGDTVSTSLARIVMTELGDGTVRIDNTGDAVFAVDATSDEGEAVRVRIALSLGALDLIASGDAATMVYDYDSDAITAELTELTVDGQNVEGLGSLVLSGLTGRYALTDGAPMRFDSNSSAEKLTATFDFADPDTPGNSVAVTVEYAGLETASAGTVPTMATMSDPAAMLSGDVEASGSFRHQGGALAVTGQSVEDGPFNLALASASGELEYGLGADGLAWSTRNTGVGVTLSGAGIPLPEVEVTLDELEFGLTVPLQKSDDYKDVALLIHLGGLGVSEMLWSMIDPSGALPHDPATLVLALDGALRLTADLDDEAAMALPVAPIDIETLALSNLKLALGGAELTGTGHFDFSQAPAGTLPGMPGVPAEATLQLSGGNALLQKLVEVGLIPQDQAMGFQMMLGMLAKPVGDDVLESVIEFGADGSITANGNPLN